MCYRDGNCAACRYDKYVYCDHCGDRVHFCDSTGDEFSYTLCGKCFEDTAECVGCGERMDKEDMYRFVSGGWYEYWCPDCYEKEEWTDDPDYVLDGKPGE